MLTRLQICAPHPQTGGLGAMKVVKSAAHYTEAARDEITLLSQIAERDPGKMRPWQAALVCRALEWGWAVKWQCKCGRRRAWQGRDQRLLLLLRPLLLIRLPIGANRLHSFTPPMRCRRGCPLLLPHD